MNSVVWLMPVTSTLPARDITLKELKSHFNLQAASDHGFFEEWQRSPAVLTEVERSQLKRLQHNYQNLSEYRNFSEESVKMVVLSPLLDLSGFYQAPFGLATEEPVEIVSEDEGLTVSGKIDALVFQNWFWALVIESKNTQYDVLTALPQALSYMLGAPDKSQPTYGLLVNGREFVFIKLIHQPTPVYARSFALSIERDDELAQVLSVLKYIRQVISDAS